MNLFIIIGYILSCIGSWYATRKFLIKHRYEKAEISDVVFVILPIINVFTFFHYFEYVEFNVDTKAFFLLKKVNK